VLEGSLQRGYQVHILVLSFAIRKGYIIGYFTVSLTKQTSLWK